MMVGNGKSSQIMGSQRGQGKSFCRKNTQLSGSGQEWGRPRNNAGRFCRLQSRDRLRDRSYADKGEKAVMPPPSSSGEDKRKDSGQEAGEIKNILEDITKRIEKLEGKM
jgi:hypothetical protein